MRAGLGEDVVPAGVHPHARSVIEDDIAGARYQGTRATMAGASCARIARVAMRRQSDPRRDALGHGSTQAPAERPGSRTWRRSADTRCHRQSHGNTVVDPGNVFVGANAPGSAILDLRLRARFRHHMRLYRNRGHSGQTSADVRLVAEAQAGSEDARQAKQWSASCAAPVRSRSEVAPAAGDARWRTWKPAFNRLCASAACATRVRREHFQTGE
jgi:hypothetical protein